MTVTDPVKPGPRPARPPDTITIYRTVQEEGNPRADERDRFRWIRRNAAGETVTRSRGNHRHKAEAWRNIRRSQPDWERCRIVDTTETWKDPGGGTNLNSDPRPPTPPRRKPLTLHQARGRL